MDKLWEQRKDFVVWVPLSSTIDREYIYNKKFDREGYFTELSKCWVGACGQSHHTGWANSASDGMAVGVPYIFYDANYYRQYAKDAGIYFKKDEEFIKEIKYITEEMGGTLEVFDCYDSSNNWQRIEIIYDKKEK